MTARRGDAAVSARLLWPLVLVVLLCLLGGCGVRPQSHPEPVPLTEALPILPRPSGGGGEEQLAVYFVDGTRLEPVPRSAPAARPQDAVDRLLAGPTRAEVLSGLRTALSPQDLTVRPGPDDGSTVVVLVTRDFTSIGGGNQLLAVAQVVWTVTQFPGIDVVRFRLDDTPVPVPTDEGLTDGPVGRSDFASAAPRSEAPTGVPPSTTPDPGPTGSPSPTTSDPDSPG